MVKACLENIITSYYQITDKYSRRCSALDNMREVKMTGSKDNRMARKETSHADVSEKIFTYENLRRRTNF